LSQRPAAPWGTQTARFPPARRLDQISPLANLYLRDQTDFLTDTALNAVIDQIIAFLQDLQGMSDISKALTLIAIPGLLFAIGGLPYLRLTRRLRASVTRYDDVNNALTAARREATKLDRDCKALKADTPEAFLAAHAEALRDEMPERAMALSETFLTRQHDALARALRTRMEDSIGQAPEDGTPAWSTARAYAHAALALTPDDAELKSLAEELEQAESIAAASGAQVKLDRAEKRQARAATNDRLPGDLQALTKAFLDARAKGQYRTMQLLAEHGLTLTARAPYGKGSKEHLLFRRHHAEALNFCGYASGALEALDFLLPDLSAAYGPKDNSTLYTRQLLTKCLLNIGSPDRALAEVEALLPIQTEVYGDTHTETLLARNLLAESLINTGAPDRALKEVKALLPIQTEVLGDTHPHTLAARHLLAQCLKDTGAPDQALEEVEALPPIQTEVSDDAHPDTLVTRFLRAQCLMATGAPDRALAELEALLPIRTEVSGDTHPHTLRSRLLLAECLLENGRAEDAKATATGLRDGFTAAGLRPEHNYFAALDAFEAALAQRDSEGQTVNDDA